MTRTVKLFGTILDSNGAGALVLDVAPQLGDAPRFGLAGQITFLARQISSSAYVGPGRDVVVVPEHIAASKMKRPDSPPPPPGKRRGRK